MKQCSYCGNTKNLKKVKFKGTYSFDANVCPRCWHVDLFVDATTQKKLIKLWGNQEEKKITEIIVKQGN